AAGCAEDAAASPDPPCAAADGDDAPADDDEAGGAAEGVGVVCGTSEAGVFTAVSGWSHVASSCTVFCWFSCSTPRITLRMAQMLATVAARISPRQTRYRPFSFKN